MSDELNVWVKPNGVEVKVNSRPESEAEAKRQGWKKKGEKKADK